MKTIYVAEDGTEFDDKQECLAHEEMTTKLCETWVILVQRTYGGDYEELGWFLREVCQGDICFPETANFWLYREKFVELAKSFIEVDPTLKQLID